MHINSIGYSNVFSFRANPKNNNVPTLVSDYINSRNNNSQTAPVLTDSNKPVITPPQTQAKPTEKPATQRPKPNIVVVPSPPIYHLGKRQDDIRLINVDSVTEKCRASSKPLPCDFAKGNPQMQANTASMNGEINDFMQGRRGDCYLLASLYSINSTKEGKKILKDNIEYNQDGSVTVTIPGAMKAKEGYLKDGETEKCFITGKYKISKDAIEKAKKLAGQTYSFGDLDVIVTELAYEAYNAEVHITNYAMGQNRELYIPGQECGGSRADTLSLGTMHDATYILTGQKSELYKADKEKLKNLKLYFPGEYGYVETPKANNIGVKEFLKSRKDEKSVTNVYNKESDLQKMLDKYKGKEKDYAITVGFVYGFKDAKGKIRKGGGHALSVMKITDEYVIVANPYDTAKKERIPRADFEKMTNHFNVAKI